MCHKKKTSFENYNNCLEAIQLDNEINYLEQNEISVDSLKKDHKKLIKSNKLTLKTRQRFKTERLNVFTEKINKIALSSNYDKRMQPIASIETNAYGTSKDLVSKKNKRLNVTI